MTRQDIWGHTSSIVLGGYMNGTERLATISLQRSSKNNIK